MCGCEQSLGAPGESLPFIHSVVDTHRLGAAPRFLRKWFHVQARGLTHRTGFRGI